MPDAVDTLIPYSFRQGDMLMNLIFAFDGRIGRSQFWLGYLVLIILMFLFAGIVTCLEPSAQGTVTGANGQLAADLPKQVTVPQLIVTSFIGLPNLDLDRRSREALP